MVEKSEVVERNEEFKEKGAAFAASLMEMTDEEKRMLFCAVADAVEDWEDFDKNECNSTYYINFYLRNVADLFPREAWREIQSRLIRNVAAKAKA